MANRIKLTKLVEKVIKNFDENIIVLEAKNYSKVQINNNYFPLIFFNALTYSKCKCSLLCGIFHICFLIIIFYITIKYVQALLRVYNSIYYLENKLGNSISQNYQA